MILTFDHPEVVRDFLKLTGFNMEAPTLAFLAKLQESFGRFPYENLTKIIRDRKEQEPQNKLRMPECVYDEHLAFGAGGTCFSLTYFFQSVLKACGFETYIAMADRHYGANTHCASVVTLGGERYLVDPGYCLKEPIALDSRGAELAHNKIILTRGADSHLVTLSTLQAGEKKARYTLKDVPTKDDEFLGHWFESFGWPMMRNACVTKLVDDGYVFMRNGFVRYSTKDKKANIKKFDMGIDNNLIEEALCLLGTRR